ncbi:MAG: hypothetical protein COU08_03795 [Candidatus Harrisonbacteria bacterium CG10_big_fil_rev_8_21_14_0_10_42_17]|uniref:Uncharacterized protein n=1 Tax=Candidatus Harrisonbacteria bacterium CG10_big_fil_rev_8_21_14_0_10_42_17 TaxID=1974584 RepID=A0A2M6WHC7_9BACT|nr:MAG: hypothetical protein COU08_03795 [Candidatus Harrisonbacteria bacterium CG10_big_fil_rev_8_21_14_0_10_42_17]
MAIVLKKRKRSINWFGLGSVAFVFIFLTVAAYYLFFAPSPKFEAIIPPALLEANDLTNIQFVAPETIINDQKFTRLRPYADDPGVGVLGRPNPFLPTQIELELTP